MHNTSFLHPNLLLSKAQEEYTSFLMAQAHLDLFPSPQTGRPNNLHWYKPPTGFPKANWDAAYNRKAGKLSFGAIIRDDKSVVIGTMRASRNFNANPLIAYAYGLLLTAQFAKMLGQGISSWKMTLCR